MSTNVGKCAVRCSHPSAPAACRAAVSAHPAAAPLDTISPTEGGGTVRNGQAGDLEFNAVDGGGGHSGVVVNDGTLARIGGRARTPPAHESIQVGRCHVGGIAVGMAPCPPPRLCRRDHASVAILRTVISLALDPHGLAGFQVGALREDCHRIGCGCSGILQGQGAGGQPAP